MGIRGFGATVEAAFENAALALVAVTVEPELILPREEIKLECEAPDLELLLVDWLNAVIFAMATHRLLFGRFAVRFEGKRLLGHAWGERLDPARHHPGVEVKGATLTAVAVRREPSGRWLAQCVVDV